MNIMALLGVGALALIGFGVFVDYMYKKKGIVTDPHENQKHVNPSERAYVESMLNHHKDQHNNPF
ncbi:hypothetical protein A8F94_22270 [Bacillus sp. FJAT-27225]|uniref:hypothetical protein n=1 Tax=Bacillus sp. FJAT-27225 TaxID=1743144 RepID=UPI00080C2814|nr:hypothetical protein [Bacillus sp. FJAT-27225]OCA81597.1 hypothetical protein A8F94_22270 [Bacillus sp. FJAT-27225]